MTRILTTLLTLTVLGIFEGSVGYLMGHTAGRKEIALECTQQRIKADLDALVAAPMQPVPEGAK